MRRILFLVLLAAAPAGAQTPPQSHESCVDVKVGSAQSYDCLNQKFRALSKEAHQSSETLQAPPYSTASPPNVTGQFDEQATRERLGTNFGKSVTPQRPVQSYGNAFAPHH